MSNFRVALIAPYGIENNGIRHIVAYLRQRGYDAPLIFFKNWTNYGAFPPTDKEMDLLLGLLRDLRVDLIGLGFVSSYFPIMAPIIRRIRSELDAPVVLGGIHATAKPERCLEIADIVCVGEGEAAMAELVDRLAAEQPVDDVANLWLKKDGEVNANPVRPLIPDLDSLPFREFSGKDVFEITRNKLSAREPIFELSEFRIYTSRGCPYACTYCYNSFVRRMYKGEPNYYRQRSVQHVIDELKYVKPKFKHLRKVVIDDDVFLPGSEWIEEFIEKYPKEIGLPFECMLHPDAVDEAALRRLKEAGLRRVLIGVQTGSPREAREVFGRSLDTRKIIDFGRLCRRHRIESAYDFIVDNPLATEEDKRATIDLVLSLPRPFNLFLYSLTAFPGAVLTEKLIEKGVISERDVEGERSKATVQHRATFAYPRPPFDAFELALLSLASKSFVPKWFVRWLYRREQLSRHPAPLLAFAYACNVVKILGIAAKMMLRGEFTMFRVRQHWRPRSLLIQ